MGGPDRYLPLDDDGRTVARVPSVRPDLPLLPIEVEPELVTQKPLDMPITTTEIAAGGRG